MYSEIITNLISMGALLSSVKPELLLSKDNFGKFIKLKQEKVDDKDSGDSIEWLQKMECHFSIISKEAWKTLLLQLLRIFVVQSITLRHFRTLPGVDKDESELSWTTTKGNIYASPECVLLKWTSYHMWKVRINPSYVLI